MKWVQSWNSPTLIKWYLFWCHALLNLEVSSYPISCIYSDFSTNFDTCFCLNTEILPCFCKRVDANGWHNQVFACKPPCRIYCRSHDDQSFWGGRAVLFKELGPYWHKCKSLLPWFLSQRVVDPTSGNSMCNCSYILSTCHKFASYWSFCFWLVISFFNYQNIFTWYIM